MIFIIMTLLCAAGETWAGNGLSDEVLLNKQWHDLEFSRSLIMNPSFAAFPDRPTISAALSTTQWGSFFLVNSQVTIPVSSTMKKSQTIGISYTGFSSGKFEQTEWVGGKVVNKADGSSYSEHYGTLTYSLMPFPFMATGINVNVARQSNYSNPIIDASLDIGASFRWESARFGKHIIGIGLLNPARLSRFELPVYTPDVGISWDGTTPPINTDLTFVGGIDANFRSFWGESFSYPRKDLVARLGVNIRKIITCYVQGGRYYFGISGKLDLDAGMQPLSRQFKNRQSNDEETQKNKIYQFHKASAAYQILNTEKQIRPTNTLYLSGEFGKERDEGDDCFKMYRKAKQLFNECVYWEAYAYFSIIERDCSDFPKIDEVRVLSGYCLEQLHQNDLAVVQYATAKEKYQNHSAYNDGVIMGAADLGLFRLYAKGDNVSQAESQYNQLKRSATYDSVKQYGHYLYGLFKMAQADSSGAVAAFNSVENENHPVYPFAQYSKGVCFSSENETKNSFKNAIGFGTRIDERHARCNEAEAQREIVNKSRFALASYYYEKYRDNVKNLQQCDGLRSSISHDVSAAIGLVDGGRCAFVVNANNDPLNLVSNNPIVSVFIGRSILNAFNQIVASMSCKEIGMNFRIDSSRLVIRIGNLPTGWIQGDNAFRDALHDERLRAALENSKARMSFRCTDLHLDVATYGIVIQSRGDSLKVTIDSLLFRKETADQSLSNILNDLISNYSNFDRYLKDALTNLDSIPETSRFWGAEMYYLYAWVHFQQKNWDTCMGYVNLLDQRLKEKKYSDVKEYMIADGLLLKASSLMNDKTSQQEFDDRKLLWQEMYDTADGIMTKWLSSINITNEAEVREKLKNHALLEMVLHDTLVKKRDLVRRERDNLVLTIKKSVDAFGVELNRKEKTAYRYKGKGLETLMGNYSSAIDQGDKVIKKMDSSIEWYTHYINRTSLIVSIIADIKNNTLVHNETPVNPPIDSPMNQPVNPLPVNGRPAGGIQPDQGIQPGQQPVQQQIPTPPDSVNDTNKTLQNTQPQQESQHERQMRLRIEELEQQLQRHPAGQ